MHRDPTDAAVTVQTSGTTGPPKRMPVPWETFVRLGGPARPPVSGRGALILSLPLVTLGGLLSTSRLVFGGRPMSMMERFDVHAWARLVKRHRPKVMGAPPPVVKMILDAEITADHFDGVTAYMTSSAAIAPELIVEFERRYGIPVLLGYGATEFLHSVTGWTPQLWERFGAAKVGSVGRALPDVQLRVVDGVLEVDPPQRAGGLASGWLRTSDRARIDDDGFVWILGRTDDVIVRGGFKVDLGSVEAAAREPSGGRGGMCGGPPRRPARRSAGPGGHRSRRRNRARPGRPDGVAPAAVAGLRRAGRGAGGRRDPHDDHVQARPRRRAGDAQSVKLANRASLGVASATAPTRRRHSRVVPHSCRHDHSRRVS